MVYVQTAWKKWCSSSTWLSILSTDRRIFVALLLVHFLLSGWFISRLDFTSDESDYFGFVVRWTKGNQQRISPTDDSKSPIVLPSLIPAVLKPFVTPQNDAHGFAWLQGGRWCMYIFQLAGAFILLFWLYRWWGPKKWLLPLLLYLFDPVVFSYGMIVGSDLPCAVLLLASCYFAWRYWQTHLPKYWLWLTLACGLAMVAKASMLYVVPLLALIFLIAGKNKTIPSTNHPLSTAAKRWLFLIAGCWLIINLAYYFQGSFFTIHQLPQRSDVFRNLAANLSWLGNFPIPLPYSYVSGFDYLKFNQQLGGGDKDFHSFLGVYVMSRYYAASPVWWYYLATWLFKLPLLIWALMITSFWWVGRCGKIVLVLRRYAFVWVPAVFYFSILSFTNPFQIGIRHSLLVFPFLYLAISYAVVRVYAKWQKFFRGVLVLHAISLLSFWPNMLAYTNELIWNKAQVSKYLYDSSVVYGNAKPYLKRYLQLHPEYKVPTATPQAGKFAIGLEEVASPLNTFGLQWLYQNFEPVGHYMHVILLYEITPADLEGLQKK